MAETHPLIVALDAPPSDYPVYVAALLNTAFATVAPTRESPLSREEILADYHRFAATNTRQAEFFLARFSAITAKRMTGVLPGIVRDIERGAMELDENATIVMVSRAVLEEGVRVWVLHGDAGRGEP